MVKNIIESVLKKDPVSTHDHVKKEMSKRIHESLDKKLAFESKEKPREHVNENYEIEMTSNYSVYEDKMGNFTLINEKSRNKEEVYLQGDDAHEFRKELEKVKNERQFDDLISQYEDVME